MSTFHRDLMAAAHFNQASLVNEQGKTVDIIDGNSNTSPVGWTGLIAVRRNPNQAEINKFSGLMMEVDMTSVFEIARQGGFPGNSVGLLDIRPGRYKISYAGLLYEVNNVTTDDSEVIDSNNKEAAAVIVFICKRLMTGLGELPY